MFSRLFLHEQKMEIVKLCSPWAVDYFLKLVGDRHEMIMKDPEDYQALLLTLVGKRGHMPPTLFEMIKTLLNDKQSKWKHNRLRATNKLWVFFDMCMLYTIFKIVTVFVCKHSYDSPNTKFKRRRSVTL